MVDITLRNDQSKSQENLTPTQEALEEVLGRLPEVNPSAEEKTRVVIEGYAALNRLSDQQLEVLNASFGLSGQEVLTEEEQAGRRCARAWAEFAAGEGPVETKPVSAETIKNIKDQALRDLRYGSKALAA